jgi:HSP20 family molecular chaperone IbpA
MTRKNQKNLSPVVQKDGGFLETFDAIQNRIRKRAHEMFQMRDSNNGDHLTDWFNAESEVLTEIALDWKEKPDRYVLSGKIDGFAPNEINIQCADGRISVGGSHKVEKAKDGEYTSSEINFFRTVSLPQGVDTAHLETKFENGYLEVVLPKVIS